MVNIILTGVGTGISFLVQMLLARKMGPDQFGLYAYAMGWTALALLPAKLDLDNAATRFVGAHAGNDEWDLVRGFIRRGAQIVLLSSAIVAVLGAFAMAAWSAYRGQVTSQVFLAAAIFLPATALMLYLANVLQGFRRVAASQAPPLVLRPVLFGLGCITLAVVNAGALRASTAILLNLASTLVVLVIQFRLIVVTLSAHPAAPRFETPTWMRAALGLLSVSVAQLVLSGQTDVVVVGTLLSKADAGHYAIASQMATTLMMGTTAMAWVAAPAIAQHFRAGDRVALQGVINRVRHISLAITIPGIIIVLLIGRPVLGLFGPSFRGAFPVLVILSLGGLHGAAGGAIAGFLLTMTGHERAGALIIGASAVSYLVLVAVLAPRLGAVGVALATFTAYLIRALWLGAYIRSKLGYSVWFAARQPLAPAGQSGS